MSGAPAASPSRPSCSPPSRPLVPAGTRPWDGLRVLVSAGGTREPIDAVRYVGNRSSGRMGFAVAEEAAARGAQVTVIAANVTLARSPAISYVDVGTAAELDAACSAAFAGCDVLVMTAAVADFRPAAPDPGKRKKAGREGMTIELEAHRGRPQGPVRRTAPRADARRVRRRAR